MSITSTPAVPSDHENKVVAPVRRRPNRLLRWLLLIGVVWAVVWSLVNTDVSAGSLVAGREGAVRLGAGLFPPDLHPELLTRVGAAVVETLQISIAALFLCTLLGLFLAVVMATNVHAPRLLAGLARGLATTLRGVPELLWALLFVATVGLGPAAGVYAITLHGAGILAKLCSEHLEAVDPGPVEAVRLTGASRMATALLAILPQARANIASQVLYQWECNIRSSVVIGFVGAGGIGQALGISMNLFRYQEMATLIIAVLVLVIGVDWISRAARGRLGASALRTRPTWLQRVRARRTTPL